MDNTRTSANLLVGCSVIGPKHVQKDLPNQDAYATERLNNGRSIIAVADGLGEADLAHKGSELATKEAVDELRQTVNSVDNLSSESIEKHIKDSIKCARRAIRNKAENADTPVQELETTLLVAVIGPTGAAGAVVGDGGIVCNVDDEYMLLVEREEALLDLSASHITVPVMQDNWEESYRFGTIENCDGIAVFSDGLEEFTWEGANANTDFFDSIFALVSDFDDPIPAAETLSSALKDHPYKEFGDDKTIVVGDLPPTYEPNKIQIEGDGTRTLGDEIDYRSESIIFPLNEEKNKAVRIFSSSKQNLDKLEYKVEAMIKNIPSYDSSHQGFSLAWPSSIAKSFEEDQFIGYKFPLPMTETSQDILEAADKLSSNNKDHFYSNTGLLNRLLQSFRNTKDHKQPTRYQIALNLAQLVSAVHQQNHAFGKLHPDKFLVDQTNVYATDCVELHVEGPEGTFDGKPPSPDYTPPEDSVNDLIEFKKSDVFGLAILIFQIVMEGFHPFEAQGSAATEGSYEKMIETNDFPYRDPQSGKLEPPAEAPAYDRLPKVLREKFDQTFIEGKLNPDIRPSAADWVEIISSVVDNNK